MLLNFPFPVGSLPNIVQPAYLFALNTHISAISIVICSAFTPPVTPIKKTHAAVPHPQALLHVIFTNMV